MSGPLQDCQLAMIRLQEVQTGLNLNLVFTALVTKKELNKNRGLLDCNTISRTTQMVIILNQLNLKHVPSAFNSILSTTIF